MTHEKVFKTVSHYYHYANLAYIFYIVKRDRYVYSFSSRKN